MRVADGPVALFHDCRREGLDRVRAGDRWRSDQGEPDANRRRVLRIIPADRAVGHPAAIHRPPPTVLTHQRTERKRQT